MNDLVFDRLQAVYDNQLPDYYDAPCEDCGDIECSCEEAEAFADYHARA